MFDLYPSIGISYKGIQKMDGWFHGSRWTWFSMPFFGIFGVPLWKTSTKRHVQNQLPEPIKPPRGPPMPASHPVPASHTASAGNGSGALLLRFLDMWYPPKGYSHNPCAPGLECLLTFTPKIRPSLVGKCSIITWSMWLIPIPENATLIDRW